MSIDVGEACVACVAVQGVGEGCVLHVGVALCVVYVGGAPCVVCVGGETPCVVYVEGDASCAVPEVLPGDCWS